MAAEGFERSGVFASRSARTTEALGEALGRALFPGALVALVGELGAGKTTLVRGLARGLGIVQPVSSPTFTRMRLLYGRLALHHFDAWRSGSAALFAEGTELLAGEGVAARRIAVDDDRVGGQPGQFAADGRHVVPGHRASHHHPQPSSLILSHC